MAYLYPNPTACRTRDKQLFTLEQPHIHTSMVPPKLKTIGTQLAMEGLPDSRYPNGVVCFIAYFVSLMATI